MPYVRRALRRRTHFPVVELRGLLERAGAAAPGLFNSENRIFLFHVIARRTWDLVVLFGVVDL